MQGFNTAIVVICSLSVITTLIGLVSALFLYLRFQLRILLIISGVLIAYLLNSLGTLVGATSTLINGQDVPLQDCDVIGFFKTLGLSMSFGQELLIDYTLYMNIFSFQAYKNLISSLGKIITIMLMIFVYGLCVAVMQIIQFLQKRPIVSPFYKKTDYVQQISCAPIGDNSEFWVSIYLGAFIDLPSFLVLVIDIYIVSRIVYFYRNFAQSNDERRHILYLLFLPLLYTFLALVNIMNTVLMVTNEKRLKNNPSGNYFPLASQILYVCISFRGLAVALVYGMQILNFNITYQSMGSSSSEIEELEQTLEGLLINPNDNDSMSL